MKKVTCNHDTMIIPKTAYIALSQLSDSDLGKYVRMIFDYGFCDKEPDLSPIEAAMLAPIFEFIDKNLKAYEQKQKEISEARSRAANARWHKQEDANACKDMQMHANDALNININKNINKNINNNIDLDNIYGEVNTSPITKTNQTNIPDDSSSGVYSRQNNIIMAPPRAIRTY